MPWTATYVIQDGKGATSTTQVHFPDSTTWDDAQEMAADVAQAMAKCLTGKITACKVTADIDVSALTDNTVGVNSDVEEGARFIFISQNGYTFSTRLATFNESYMVTGSQQVDTTETDVNAFIAIIRDGATMTSTNLVLPCEHRGDDIVSLKSALDAFTKTRKVR